MRNKEHVPILRSPSLVNVLVFHAPHLSIYLLYLQSVYVCFTIMLVLLIAHWLERWN